MALAFQQSLGSFCNKKRGEPFTPLHRSAIRLVLILKLVVALKHHFCQLNCHCAVFVPTKLFKLHDDSFKCVGDINQSAPPLVRAVFKAQVKWSLAF